MIVSMFDPRVFVWDRDKYSANEFIYLSLVNDMILVIDHAAEFQSTFAMSPSLSEYILDNFPFVDSRANKVSFLTLSQYVCTLIAKWINENITYAGASPISMTPDMIFATSVINQEVKNGIAYIGGQSDCAGLITHDIVCSELSSEIQYVTTIGNGRVKLLKNAQEYLRHIVSVTPTYDENDKHDSRSGFGSRLPDDLDQTKMQYLLDRSTWIDKPRVCVVYSICHGIPLIFRRHHLNLYHGYPGTSQDLQHLGITVDDVNHVNVMDN